jgi:hypothetical protein
MVPAAGNACAGEEEKMQSAQAMMIQQGDSLDRRLLAGETADDSDKGWTIMPWS